MYLFFDTETTGLPKKWKAPVTDLDNWPRMIQIGWTLCNKEGKRVDSALLHLKEWLNAIRNGTPVSCGIKEGFEEAITAHMASISWKLGQRLEWDATADKIRDIPDVDLDQVLLS